MTFDEMFAQAKALLENASAKDTDAQKQINKVGPYKAYLKLIAWLGLALLLVVISPMIYPHQL